jgi:rhodanese-related sulfurtransferase
MFETLMPIIVVMVIFVLLLTWKRRRDTRRRLQEHSITAERLYQTLGAGGSLVVLDVRLPLDFLTDNEIIPGARRTAPSEIIAQPNLMAKEDDYVLCCTCPGDRTSEIVLERALKLGFPKINVLTGGLNAWKEKGYPVELYEKPFHLDTQ